ENPGQEAKKTAKERLGPGRRPMTGSASLRLFLDSAVVNKEPGLRCVGCYVFRTTACAFVSSITTAGKARPVHVMTRVLVIRKIVLAILPMKICLAHAHLM
ncbi:MAG: hypothetical protein ACK55Z_04580, partial [bacterium]